MSTYKPARTAACWHPSRKVGLGSIASVIALTSVILAGGAGLWPLSAQAAPQGPETTSPESSASPAAPSASAQPLLETPSPDVAASPAAAEPGISNGYAKPEGPGAEMGSAGKSAANGAPGQTRSLPRAQALGLDGSSARAIQPDGTEGLPLGMDVSGWQPTVDWAGAWANGARFAYIKASEGPWTMNDYFAQQYNGAAAVGMVRGAYHFARPHISGGKNQAEVFIQSGGGWSADGKTLPGVLDLEAHVPVSAADKVGSCYNMTPAQLVAWTRDFTSTYKNLTSRDAVIYSSYSFWQTCMGNTTAFSAINPLWIAAYGPPLSGVLMPGGWPAFTFWQYADAGTFPGDQNVFNGSYDQLKTFVGGREAPIAVTVRDVVAGKDFDGDGVPDVIATKSDGTLWFYPGSGTGAVGAARKIG
ncbi:GH25 family lysozyme, partial [Arthrobacter glacialis]|uniref:GH25 family lysozyme n=1 Tax=Arthrobacter glacialis TaxID=1664 RepID=UPI00243460A8